jgi:hypothetical protein
MTAIGRLITLIEKRLLVFTASPSPQGLTLPTEELVGENQAMAASGEQINANPRIMVQLPAADQREEARRAEASQMAR